jgi:hypothetical protein
MLMAIEGPRPAATELDGREPAQAGRLLPGREYHQTAPQQPSAHASVEHAR